MLNHRDSYNLTIPEGLNVTANYFPVTSAIAIRDEDLQLTVMNSHTQGGSSLREGHIELMQHRMTSKHDGRGVSEPLFDVEPCGCPITAQATYYVQLFDRKDKSQ